MSKFQHQVGTGAKLFFYVIAVVFLLVLARSVLNFGAYLHDWISALMAFGIPLAGGVTAIICASLSYERRVNLALLCVSVVAPLYFFEAYGIYGEIAKRSQHIGIAAEFAAKAGRVFDSRTPREFVLQYNKSNREKILPVFPASNVPFYHEKTGAMFVRGSVPRHLSLGGNESGQYVIYRNDELGFKNAEGIWGKNGVFLLAVGDSFLHGVSVDTKDDIVGRIREKYLNSLSLGWSGIGPLYYYQNIVEYGTVLRPKVVLFFWFEGNDVTDLLEELATPLLSKFVGRREPFGLYHLQAELAEYHRKRLTVREDDTRPTAEDIRHFVMLYRVRKMLGLGAVGSRRPEILDVLASWNNSEKKAKTNYPPLASEALVTILQDAKSLTESWGGHFFFVYLPAWERLCQKMAGVAEYCRSPPHDYRRQEVLKIVQQQGISLIDMTEEFEQSSQIDELFFYPGSHYSPTGYRLVADACIRRIAAAGIGR